MKKKSLTLSVPIVAGLVFGPGDALLDGARSWLAKDAGGTNSAVERLTGWNGVTKKMNYTPLIGTYAPLAAGLAISWVGSQLKVNQKLARMHVPVLRM